MKVINGILIIYVLVQTFGAHAQDDSGSGTGPPGISIALSGVLAYDDGISADIGSPSFFRDHLRIRLKGTTNWSGVYFSQRHDWITYSSACLSVVYQTRIIDRTRLFTESGIRAIFGNRKLTSHSIAVQYLQSIGVEMFLIRTNSFAACYTFSSGYAFNRINADRLEGSPQYANDLMFSTGIRFYFYQIRPD